MHNSGKKLKFQEDLTFSIEDREWKRYIKRNRKTNALIYSNLDKEFKLNENTNLLWEITCRDRFINYERNYKYCKNLN